MRALANVYEDFGDFLHAQRLYEQALELEPDNVVLNMNLGRMLKKNGDLGAAKIYVERALLLDPEYAAARKLVAQLSLAEDQHHMNTD